MIRGIVQHTFQNGESIAVQDIAEMPLEDFLQGIVALTGMGWRVVSYFGVPEREGVSLWCVLAGSHERLAVLHSWVEDRLASIMEACPEVHLFEREIAEQCGIPVDGHAWFKPVRYQKSERNGHDAWGRSWNELILPCVGDFYRIEGSEIHEVAVGPVHAGIIEPGHFRFQCHGETVFHLEIALGYQHRGIEQALIGGPHRASMYQLEAVAGDTTIGHATAYAMIREGLSGCEASVRADSIRAVALELERLANHCGDLGALSGDVGYLPTESFCGRIRGDFLNMSALLCGSRFGRGLVRPGGVNFDLLPLQIEELDSRLAATGRDYSGAVELLWNSPSVMARFEKTGRVGNDDALSLGLVGPVARACGVERDVRQDHPFGAYRRSQIKTQLDAGGGDVLARARVRWNESLASLDYIREQLHALPTGGESLRSCGINQANRLSVALVEGWRGEICHVAITDQGGKFLRYKITDPSFHNWSGLALAMRNQQISDFPLCNKSFNLSYCGFDL